MKEHYGQILFGWTLLILIISDSHLSEWIIWAVYIINVIKDARGIISLFPCSMWTKSFELYVSFVHNTLYIDRSLEIVFVIYKIVSFMIRNFSYHCL